MTLGHAVGMVLMFGVFMIPSTLFVGFVAGRLFNLQRPTRIIATIAAAILLAYGTVFHTSMSPTGDCTEPHISSSARC